MRWNRSLARRWSCLILGGALLMPYMMVGVLVSGILRGDQTASVLLPTQIGVFAAVLPVVALTGLFLPVRSLEISAAEGLLGVRVEPGVPGARRSWQERRRTAAWYTMHLAVGGLASGFTLAVVPFTVVSLALPFVGGAPDMLGYRVDGGWQAVGWAAAGVALLVPLVLLVHWSAALLARLAPPLLGPTPAERLAAAEEHARTLAQRNRLARELHDSVGHALSVVTLQAAAAGRVLDRDPALARTALSAIEQSARSALEDLDHVLGLLREDDRPASDRPVNDRPVNDRPTDDRDQGADDPGRSREPAATLARLPELVAGAGVPVRLEAGDLAAVPGSVSREAYRIVQEALTNAIKHGRPPVDVTVGVREHALHLEVVNRTGGEPDRGRPGGGGRGVAGMRERVRLLGGEMDAGPREGGWHVRVRLPLRSHP
ncbi:sensor histidine kinase [Nonomuraea ceibae]|uniref:sensor histidine kinase n=1 Tax=Nonomuraea ceibae TaxID=1935170 RepID=UPI0027E0D765|nr:histidine kinase [Nonomuraea ceibae]